MISQPIPLIGAFAAWRQSARSLLSQNIPPEQVSWQRHTEQKVLFDQPMLCAEPDKPLLTVPKEFIDIATKVVAHKNDQCFAWLYKVLWRMRAEGNLISNPADKEVHHLNVMSRSVSRDCHKMKAFVRFRELEHAGARRKFAAWFEPEHYIVDLTGPFFARRFADMDWVISTPYGIARFVDGILTYHSPDGDRHAANDDTEALWLTYFSNIFNPARLKIKAMESEMPKKFWKNLPEAALIPDLISQAEMRVRTMQERLPTHPPAHLHKVKSAVVPREVDLYNKFKTLEELNGGAIHCKRCPLYSKATQTVCGEGSASAKIMFVGEQPGDQEDLSGKPFVGPAGRIFDEALRAAQISRDRIYVTNAVKHFKFSPRGKRRIHERPNKTEMLACYAWLENELDIVKPQIVVAMGATAVEVLTGTGKSITTRRGKIEKSFQGLNVFITNHPSAILRNVERSETLRRDFFNDFAAVSRLEHDI